MNNYQTFGEQMNYQVGNSVQCGQSGDLSYVPKEGDSCESGVLNKVSTMRILP